MNTNNQNQFVVYTIEGSTIKKFLIIDLLTGTGLYWVVKLITASVLISMVGSFVGAEGIKRIPRIRKIKPFN